MSVKISQNKTVKYSNTYKLSEPTNVSEITVFSGPMFSGKTKALLCKVRANIAENKKVSVFKPRLDNRYSKSEIVSHDKDRIEALSVTDSTEILKLIDGIDVVAIDEVQFFDSSIVNVVEEIASMRKEVLLAGLDLDYKGEPFGSVPALMAKADNVIKLHAVCSFCSAPAKYTHRTIKNEALVLLGEKDKYVPLCRSCFKELT